ncbi:MAG TPA: hypothetical protein VGE55_03775 [Limnobacter sp.]|uniref:hypothetical protein n=1 Tax=Limnobacter sp. TaxID=2003368 RepID=UPI002ED98671
MAKLPIAANTAEPISVGLFKLRILLPPNLCVVNGIEFASSFNVASKAVLLARVELTGPFLIGFSQQMHPLYYPSKKAHPSGSKV